jgi:phage terminase large subunit-like protein
MVSMSMDSCRNQGKKEMPEAAIDLKEFDLAEIKQNLAKKKHLRFMRYCWRKAEPFKVGQHTVGICNEVDKAFENYRNGISTYLAISVVNRHGKSDCSSRFLPAHFLGEFPEKEVIVTACNSELAESFSQDSRSIMQTDSYAELYPEVTLSEGNRSVKTWSVNDGIGRTFWCGIRSGIMGKGASLLVVDDFVASRADAESATIREKTWNGFSDDAMTRLAPVHIVIIVATAWHTDDIFGRIKKHMKEDPHYPRFNFIKYPAFREDYPGEKVSINGIQMGMLFPEMYSKQWYLTQKASKSNYSFCAIMQCDPIEHGENMIRTDKISYIHTLPEGLKWVRAWDLASTEKELKKDDPDYTASVEMAIRWIPSSIPGVRTPIIFLKNGIHGRWKASTRNDIIKDTAISEKDTRVGSEAFGAYKDTFTTLRDVLMGLRHVEELRLPGSKAAKGEPLVAPFEAGNVYVYYPLKKGETKEENEKPEWVSIMLDELETAPFGAHDDLYDSLCMGYDMCTRTSSELFHTDSKIVSDEKLIDVEVINGIYMREQEAKAYIVTAHWKKSEGKIHVVYESCLDTIEDITKYIKAAKKCRTVGSPEINSASNRSLNDDLMLKNIYIEIDEELDSLGSLYFMNAMIDKHNFTVSSKCRNLLLALQNDTDLKELSPYSLSLLYIINNINIKVKTEREVEELKPFTKERMEYIKEATLEMKTKDFHSNKGFKEGWK